MTVPPPAFAALHTPALERDQVKHNVLLANLGRLTADDPSSLRLWSLGSAGACAVQAPGSPIMLGDLTEAQCHALAEETQASDYPGVIGPDETAAWFAARATMLGVRFTEPVSEQVYALDQTPRYPEVWGCARLAGANDAALFTTWRLAFLTEASPHDPVPEPERLAQSAAAGRYHVWIDEHRPVAMAGLLRRTSDAGGIGDIYTPPEFRGRGYAGAVIAAIADRIFHEGKRVACVAADRRNEAADRCYTRIGFRPHCRSWHYPRAVLPS